MRPVHHWVRQHGQSYPERTALITDQGKITYGELHSRALRAARLLRGMGIGEGDRFGVLAMNLPEFIELLLAAGHTSSILVPLNYRLSPAELAFQIKDSGCSALFVGREQVSMVSEILTRTRLPAERVVMLDRDAEFPGAVPYHGSDMGSGDLGDGAAPEDPLLICYTSGTTGRPKGAVLTHGNMFANAINAIVPLGFTHQDRFLTLLPLIHVGGIGLFTLPALLLGAAVILPRRFEPDHALRLIEQERATVVMVVPTVLKMLTEAPAWPATDLSSVRYFINGGDRCPLELVRRVRDRGVAMGGGYGLTESSPTAFMIHADELEAGTRAEGFIGKPAPLTEARIVAEDGRDCAAGEVGEIWLRGPNIFQGFWNLADATEAAFTDGWFRTGDLARRDPDGQTFVVGRKKEMIKSGGENIYPAEVEAVLQEHPAVAEVCVVGRPDPKWIEVPVAVVALRPGSRVTAAELSEFAAARLAKFKVPKDFLFVNALPRTSIGKVARSEVRDLYVRERGLGD